MIMVSQLSRTAPSARHANVQPIAATPELPSAIPLMALSTGFWAFKTLAAAHELDLFSRLAGGAGVTVARLAETLGLHPRPAEMLLTGCAALGLLDKTDGRYRNTPLSEAYLVRGKPYYFGGFVQMADKRLYAGWGRLTEALRTNRPTTWDPSAQSSMFDSEDPTMLALFWEAMHSLSTRRRGSSAKRWISDISTASWISAADRAHTTSSFANSMGRCVRPCLTCRMWPRSPWEKLPRPV
jgi:hypothetical protein